MGKVVLNLAVTLDGFIEGPNGEYDWCLDDQDYGMEAFLSTTDTILIGRKSYDLIMSQGVDYFPGHIKYVFSNNLDEVNDVYRLLKSPSKDRVLEIIQQSEKDLWLFGGQDLLRSFLDWGLVDRLMLAVHPIILGTGTHLFPVIKERIRLNFVEAISYDSGLVMMVYDLKAN